MKKIILPIVILVLVGFGKVDPGLSDAERNMALERLETTKELLVSKVEGLSNDQLNFKPAPDSWSVAECVEHLVIAENAFGKMLEKALQTPADPSKRDSVSMTDTKIADFTANRQKKVKTTEPFEPSGKFGSHEETLKAFVAKRNEHIGYLKTTQHNLRNHYGQLPFGIIDGFQIFLFMGGHTERHILQMTEVMSHADFPGMAVAEPN